MQPNMEEEDEEEEEGASARNIAEIAITEILIANVIDFRLNVTIIGNVILHSIDGHLGP